MSQGLNPYPHGVQGCFCFYSRPNCSLTRMERKCVFVAIAAVTLLIASVFGSLGYWPVLPFAGLEIGVLAWAFDALAKRVGDYESLKICGDEITIERRQGGQYERRTLNCQWARLVLAMTRPGGRVGLALRSHGRVTELGMFLTDEARMKLAGELQAWIKPGK